MIKLPFPLILASASPRRKELLRAAGFSFQTIPSRIEESFDPKDDPVSIAKHLAMEKAKSISGKNPNLLVIGADTLVVKENKILGKPRNKEEAVKMLEQLNNCRHQVISGVALLGPGIKKKFAVQTDVYFYQLKKNEIQFYVDNFKVMDKAGAYGIQDWIGLIGVKKIRGDYNNVVGLPMSRLFEEFKKLSK